MASRKKKRKLGSKQVDDQMPWLDPRARDLLDLFLDAAQQVAKPYAIGGAVAMASHGFIRQTRDVDAYVDYEDRAVWLRALRERGLSVEPLVTGIHYIAYLPEHGDPELRIDVMVPADDPDVSAVAVPDKVTLAGRTLEVFPIDLLVIAKYQSEGKGPRRRA